EVAFMFLEEATRTAPACEQLECRAEYALHAAIGLDVRRRDAVDQLLRARLRDHPKSPQALSLAWVSSRWGHLSAPLAGTTAEILARALTEQTESTYRRDLAVGLSSVIPRMETAKAVELLVAAL